MVRTHIIKLIAGIKLFILSGSSSFSVVSLVTGKRYMYKVDKFTKAEDKGLYFVKAFDGTLWVYCGTIFKEEDYRFRYTNKTNPAVQGETYFTAFDWLWNNYYRKDIGCPKADILYSGKCSVCSRTLKSKRSSERGLGPGCAKKINL